VSTNSVRNIVGLLCVVAVMAFGPASAFAQTTSQGVYDEAAPLGQIENVGQGGGGDGGAPGVPVQPTAQRSDKGSLPFTGLDLGIAAILGLTLVGTGVAVRRVARSTSS
jgi:hypothetical protein